MLDMYLTLIFPTAIIFLALLVILNKILYKPLLEFMDNRDTLIKKDLENATKNSDDTNVYYEEANKIILEAKNQAAKERADLLAKEKIESEAKIKERKGKLEAEYNEFIKTLEKEKKELKNALNSQLPLYKEAIKAKLSKI
ncbi:MAG: F0F1 ATP synthase subunit B' [Campylobacteraceae bacterium]|jgi:F-type H+-transporting ATPase subunit b|nr:F0F1 ATP synthase subunit B' [Campylobacteraceae bacterium]